jgi:hypothetical protein
MPFSNWRAVLARARSAPFMALAFAIIIVEPTQLSSCTFFHCTL